MHDLLVLARLAGCRHLKRLLFVLPGRCRVPQGAVPISIQVNLINRFKTPRIADLDASRWKDDTRFSCRRCALRAWVLIMNTMLLTALGSKAKQPFRSL